MGSGGSDDTWDWVLSPRAEGQFSGLESEMQERIVSKLDEVITSEWREPGDFLEPLTGSPFHKLRVGDYRIGRRLDVRDGVLRVESIRKREGALPVTIEAFMTRRFLTQHWRFAGYTSESPRVSNHSPKTVPALLAADCIFDVEHADLIRSWKSNAEAEDTTPSAPRIEAFDPTPEPS